VQYGPLALDVPPGDWRNLTLLEVAKLKTAQWEGGLRVREPRYCAANAKSRTYQAKADTKFSAFAAGSKLPHASNCATISCVETDAPIKKRKF